MVKPNFRAGLRWCMCGLVMAACIFAQAVLAQSDGIQAQLDRERALVGETVTLVFETDDRNQDLDVDLSALDADFILLDKRTETRMSIVNGRQSTVKRLEVMLEPRRAGELVVPALTFRGGQQSRALSLTVDPAPEVAPGEAAPVFMELELEPREGPYYVHAQVALKVRIFYQQNLTEASVSPPAPQQASVRLLDEVPYTADRNGERYRVLERRYAVFPERSGELVIPAMQLTGRMVERSTQGLWQPRVQGRRVRIESDPVILEIQPRPPGYSGDAWLPARQLSVSQQVSDASEIRVGEPVTRTVILDAVGLEEHMLEEPAWPEMPGARIYPDQPQGISRDDGEWVLGHREFRYAVVPEEPGELVLPELRVTWWDTANDRQRVALLPEHRVAVLPGAAPTPGASTPEPGAGAPVGTAAGAGGHWRWIALGFAVLWLATLALWFKRSRRDGAGPAREVRQVAGDAPATLKAFESACREGDATTARRQLARWLRHDGPAVAEGRIRSFARCLEQADETALAAQVRALDATGFEAGETSAWDGKSLAKAMADWRRRGGEAALGAASNRNGEGPAGAVPDLWARGG